MMRLPRFRFTAPRSVEEAAKILAGEGPDAMLVAGGTDLLPNMKRRQQEPKTLVALRHVAQLRQTRNGSGFVLGAGLTLTDLVRNETVREQYAGLWQAAVQVATPHLRRDLLGRTFQLALSGRILDGYGAGVDGAGCERAARFRFGRA